MTKQTIAEIAFNNSKWFKKILENISNYEFVKNECIKFLLSHPKWQLENQKECDCLIFLKISTLELKKKLVMKNNKNWYE